MDRSDWNARYAAADLVWGAEPNRFVAAELAECEPRGRALDLACGEGRNAIWLARQGWEVTAVDFSDVAIERARKLAGRNGVAVEWVCADLASLDLPPEPFQLVLIAYLQLPAPRLRHVLALATQAMAPGAELPMIGHALANLAEGVGGPRDPACLWTPEEIDAALRALGAAVDRCEPVRRPVDTEDGPREAIDLLVRAHRPAAPG